VFAAEFAFRDGSSSGARTAVPCPAGDAKRTGRRGR
jgi:hypothetical protein